MLKRLTLLLLTSAVALCAQPSTRRATNIAALLSYPGFFHTRLILIAGIVATHDDGQIRVSEAAGSVRLVYGGRAPDGLDEIRGEFWDLGRMRSDDPRLAAIDLRSTFQIDPDGAWPRPGEVTAIMAPAITAAPVPAAPSIRAIVLYPSRYHDRTVTVTGQFGGRNLFGDLPDAPAMSRYDFVVRSADAAIWVSSIRPKVRDQGRDIELSLDARLDTRRWLKVTGTVREGRGLQWIEADAGSLSLVKPPTDTTTEETPIRVPAWPPPEVIFSLPTDGETDVSLTTNVRIQFSRDIDPTTLKDHVRVRYLEAEPAERGGPTLEFATRYNEVNRVLEIRFANPLERFRTLTVDLLEGILGTDHQPLRPWTLTLSLGR